MDEPKKLQSTPLSLLFKKVLVRAIDDTYDYCEGGYYDDPLEAFLTRWGKVTEEQDLLRILQHGEERDRAMVLFALGHLHDPQTQTVLEPYLHSSLIWERWASALALGRWGYEPALLTLLALLQEDTLEAWIACDDEMLEDFYRRSRHRFEIVSRLGDWGNPQSVPILYHVLKKYIEEGTRFEPEFQINGRSGEREKLYALQDHLAYALGQLGAWGSLRDLPWSQGRQRIAMIFMILGALQIHREIPTMRRYLLGPEFASTILNENQLEKEPIHELLAVRFGYTKEEQDALLEVFPADCRQRFEE